MAAEDGVDASRSGSPSEERKTETTLTTRIRINIPGSRPIPPVVVRKPVADADTAAEDTRTGTDTRATSAVSALSTFDTPAEPSTPPSTSGSASASPSASAEEKPTSDWFAPRKPATAKGAQGGGSTNGAGLPGISGIQGAGGGSGTGVGAGGASGASGLPGAQGASGGPGAGGARPGGPGANGMGGARPGASGTPGATGARPGGGTGGAGPLGARPGGTNGAGLPGATGAGPVAPGHGGGTGSFDVSDAVAASTASFPVIGTDDDGEPRRDDLPYFSETGGRGPSGPTGGPVTGDGPVIPPAASNPGGPGLSAPGTGHGGPGLSAPGAPGTRGAGPGDRFAPGAPGTPGAGPGEPFAPGAGPGDRFAPGAPGTPGAGPGEPFAPGDPFAPGAPGTPGAAAGQGFPGGGLNDDTAILTPQKPAPEPGSQGLGVRHDNVSGHTVTSGIPVVPPGDRSGPFGAGSHPEGPVPHTPPNLPDAPAQQNSTGTKPAKSAGPAKKKGRNKLVLLVGGVFVIAGVAYGAGLLMNHSDVPKGTTVLGVDIGGGTRDEAVEKLDAALGGRTDKPLPLLVDGKTVSLKPDQAGLQLDSNSTVAAAAKSDYNPVSVIGSLFGQHRVVNPVMPVDEEKLQAALERLAGGSGSMVEGTIKFESGRAVAVYGRPGKGIDAGASLQAVQEAYRTEVETGSTTPVKVATTTRQPTISNAEVDRMMKAFAEPAMSQNVTVRVDAAHMIAFSPQKSLWKFLGVKAINGKLVEYYNKEALQGLYGHAFDGVLITRGTGQKTPVTVEDVIGALRPALLGKTAAERIGTINTNPS